MTEHRYVVSVENAVPSDLCERICRFLDQYADEAQEASYGVGENTFCKKLTIADDLPSSDCGSSQDSVLLRSELADFLEDFMQNVIIPLTYPLIQPVFAPFEIRKMLGPTRSHTDNVSPFLLMRSGQIRVAYRVVSLVMTVSDSTDVLYFPQQDRSINLTRGSIAFFPPYWMFEHASTVGCGPRYSVTTWINETTELRTESFVAPRTKSTHAAENG